MQKTPPQQGSYKDQVSGNERDELFEADLADIFPVASELQENGGAIKALAGLQAAHAILGILGIAPEDHLERLHIPLPEKIPEDHFRLASAVGMRPVLEGNLDLIVEKTGKHGRIAQPDGRDHVVNRIAERGHGGHNQQTHYVF
jgi:hypothetical protein